MKTNGIKEGRGRKKGKLGVKRRNKGREGGRRGIHKRNRMRELIRKKEEREE